MNAFFFDLSGTLIHHVTRRPIPYMADVLRACARSSDVYVLSRWSPDSSRVFLMAAFGDEAGEFLHGRADRILYSKNKGLVTSAVVAEKGYERCFCIDDRPDNLRSYLDIRSEAVVPIGFLGSCKYAGEGPDRLAGFCMRNSIPLALSAIDLVEVICHLTNHGFGVDLKSPFEIGLDDAIMAIRGLNHPCSALAGETFAVDHRPPMSRLHAMFFEREEGLDLKVFERFWRSLAWLRCDECICKAASWSVIAAAGLHLREDLPDFSAKIGGYEMWFCQQARDFRDALRPYWDLCIGRMGLGIREVGSMAQAAALPPFDFVRLESVRRFIDQVS